MTAVTMPNGRPQPARDEAELASLVAARLCHDLVSPLVHARVDSEPDAEVIVAVPP